MSTVQMGTRRSTERQTLTVDETARMLGVSEWLIRRMIRSGELPSTKLGTRRLISRAAVEELLAGL